MMKDLVTWFEQSKIRLIGFAVVVVAALMAYKVIYYEGHISSLLNIGAKWGYFDQFEKTLPKETLVLKDSHGYDTFTFYYLIARDPFLQNRDEWKSVKYQRLIYPLIAWGFAFGQESLLPWSMALIQLLAVAWITWELIVYLDEQRRRRIWALYGGLSAGVILSALYLITEPLGLAFALWAWRMARRQKWVLMSLALCLSVWTRESSMIFVAAFMTHFLFHQRWKAVALTFCSFVPVLVWNHVIAGFVETGQPPYLSSSGSFGFPFVGFVEQLFKAHSEQGFSFYYRDALIVPYCMFMMMAFSVAWRCWWRYFDLPSIIVLAFGAQGFLFQRPMWEGSFAITRLEVGLVVAFLFLPTAMRQARLWKWAAWGFGSYIALALVRSLRFPEALQSWYLT